jgi:hypothetical protein
MLVSGLMSNSGIRARLIVSLRNLPLLTRPKCWRVQRSSSRLARTSASKLTLSTVVNSLKLELVSVRVDRASSDKMVGFVRTSDPSFGHAKRGELRSDADTTT